jgi:8-oxo-dGTP pyrophosphatase MutT (NUDIX family)
VRSLHEIRTALASRAPRLRSGTRRAAVAVVLHDAGCGVDMLFIERARRLGDPWSGHMAFPGGRVDPTDPDVRTAAERETREEVSLDLAGAEPLGRLDDLHAGVPYVAPLVLSAFVYRIVERPPLVVNHEVREALWVPGARLLDPSCRVEHGWGPVRYPGILVGEPGRHVVWGLTYRLLEDFVSILGLTLPGPASDRG